MKSYSNQRKVSLFFRYLLLTILAILWLIPIFWIVLASFSYNDTGFISTFFPEKWTFQNYIGIFTNSQFPYLHCQHFACGHHFRHSVNLLPNLGCLRPVPLTLQTPQAIPADCPGFMSMIALYYILKGLNMLNLGGLILVYVGGAGLGFYVAKGFFDTIPRSLDEADELDGATKWQVFTKIGLPLSKPMIVYTALTTFMAPWVDFIFSGIILSTLGDPKTYTIAYGLYNMLSSSKGSATTYFAQFVAGCVITAIPITILFVIMQKFYVSGITAGADNG
ncbi:sugar ABC transporter permease [Lactobacillus delbrueckii subsp. bulgaricus]|nr:sugar ABC transporter permease [Lactobacillus delbrueckii subsp. bulgaricus]